jgi:hypothetical protein
MTAESKTAASVALARERYLRLARIRDRAIAFQYLASGDNYAAVGARFGLCGERIRQIVTKALRLAFYERVRALRSGR